MKNNIGIIYATVDGQTLKICNKIKEELETTNNTVQLISIEDFDQDLNQFDKLVIGSSIRYGVHHKKIIDFINSNKQVLESIKTAFISVNLVARKEEKNTHLTNPYVIKFFKTINWNPSLIGVFAGKLDYKKYPFFDRIMIQFIMWITKGPTNTDAEIEYTNWDKVNEFGKSINSM